MPDWPRYLRATLRGHDLHLVAGRSRKVDPDCWGPDGRDLCIHGLLLLVAGSGRYRDSTGRDESVQAGDLLVLFPGLRHRYGPDPGQDWCEAFLDCDGPLVRLLEGQGLLDRHRPHLRPEPSAVKPLRRLIDDIESGRLNDPQEAQWRLHGALLLAMRSSRPDDDTALERARQLLAADLARPCDPRRAAQAAGLGWELFRKRFRARYGLPPARWRLHARCEAAAQALLAPGATVERVATRFGFCDGAHLRRHLRTVLGMTAASFRRLHGSG